MTPERAFTLRFPEPLLGAALRAARAEEMSPADFIRAAVTDRVAEVDPATQADAVGTIRRALRGDFSGASNWLDLQRRLRAKGLVLRERAGEVVLMTWPVERRLIPIAPLGVTADELVLLYRAPFPSHGPVPRTELPAPAPRPAFLKAA